MWNYIYTDRYLECVIAHTQLVFKIVTFNVYLDVEVIDLLKYFWLVLSAGMFIIRILHFPLRYLQLRLPLLLLLLLLDVLTFQVARLNRACLHFWMSGTGRNSSSNRQEVNYDLGRSIFAKLVSFLEFKTSQSKRDAKRCTGRVRINKPRDFLAKVYHVQNSPIDTVYCCKY